MDWGMKNRLSKIIKPKTGRTVMLAVDHGYFLGPTSGLENFREAIKPLIPYCDTLFLTRGMLRTSVDPASDVPVMLRASGGTSIVGKELLHEGVTLSIEDAIRLNRIGGHPRAIEAIAIPDRVGDPGVQPDGRAEPVA